MLVISRKLLERIQIGNDIVVTVVKVGEQIKLGIEAPRDVLVVRAELKEREAA